MSERLTDEQLSKMSGWTTNPTCLQGMAIELLTLRALLREASLSLLPLSTGKVAANLPVRIAAALSVQP